MRSFLFFIFAGLASAGIAKGKAGKVAPPPTSSPTVSARASAAQVTSTTSTTTQTTTAPVATSNQTTPAVVLLDLKVAANNFIQLFEAQRYDEAARLFAPGMSYITNGRVYALDLSIPSDIRSVPERNRTQLVWTYSDADQYEIWGHCLVSYPGQADLEPEFILLHFNRNGLIDTFSHIQPKAAQCTAIVRDVVRLALMRADGTLVDAPQDQLQMMLLNQEAAKAMANGTWANGTGVWANGVWTNTTKSTVVNQAVITTINTTRITSNGTQTNSSTTVRSTSNSTRP